MFKTFFGWPLDHTREREKCQDVKHLCKTCQTYKIQETLFPFAAATASQKGFSALSTAPKFIFSSSFQLALFATAAGPTSTLTANDTI